MQLRIHRLYRKVGPSPEERARLEALLQNYYEFIRDQFTLFLQTVSDPDTLAEVIQAVEDGRTDDALAIVDSYVGRMGNTIVSAMPAIGRAEAEALATQAGVAGSGVAISFDPASPEVVAAMRRNQLQFITDFTQQQRDTVNQALQDALEEGTGAVETGRAIRDAIGLTPYQQDMVDRYRSLLEDNSARALDYQLRDRRYDPGLENAIEDDTPLSGDRIDTMVDRYRDRLLQLRGETIARTESGRIMEETRDIAARQAADDAGIPYGRVVKIWMATRDQRTRDTHQALDGQARLLEDDFDSPSGATLKYPHDSDAPAAEVIACRCTAAYQMFSSDEEVADFLRENGDGRYE